MGAPVGNTNAAGHFGSQRALKHGHARKGQISPTYISYVAMRGRVLNPRHMHYLDYGGRGIKIDQRWMKFANFLVDMGERPDGKTLDRIDVNGHYTKNNCQWADAKTQRMNQRSR